MKTKYRIKYDKYYSARLLQYRKVYNILGIKISIWLYIRWPHKHYVSFRNNHINDEYLVCDNFVKQFPDIEKYFNGKYLELVRIKKKYKTTKYYD